MSATSMTPAVGVSSVVPLHRNRTSVGQIGQQVRDIQLDEDVVGYLGPVVS
jgi:hypothetical protein